MRPAPTDRALERQGCGASTASVPFDPEVMEVVAVVTQEGRQGSEVLAESAPAIAVTIAFSAPPRSASPVA